MKIIKLFMVTSFLIICFSFIATNLPAKAASYPPGSSIVTVISSKNIVLGEQDVKRQNHKLGYTYYVDGKTYSKSYNGRTYKALFWLKNDFEAADYNKTAYAIGAVEAYRVTTYGVNGQTQTSGTMYRLMRTRWSLTKP